MSKMATVLDERDGYRISSSIWCAYKIKKVTLHFYHLIGAFSIILGKPRLLKNIIPEIKHKNKYRLRLWQKRFGDGQRKKNKTKFFIYCS